LAFVSDTLFSTHVSVSGTNNNHFIQLLQSAYAQEQEDGETDKTEYEDDGNQGENEDEANNNNEDQDEESDDTRSDS
jgi:hypothetical protein